MLHNDLALEAHQKVCGGLIITGAGEVDSRKRLILTPVIRRPFISHPSALTTHPHLTSTIVWRLAHTAASIFTHLNQAEIAPPLWLVSIILCAKKSVFVTNACLSTRTCFCECAKNVSMNKCVCVCVCVCVWVCEGGSQLNKQTLSLGKAFLFFFFYFLKHLASIQGTAHSCVFNSQLYNRLHHTCGA